MAYVNVAEWAPEHVADWLRGLDDEIQPYTQFFVNNNINGCHLLTLCRDDLTNLNINKIGHQELILDAVELLRQLHYNLTSETLQSLALKLGCKSQSLYNNLKHVSQGFVESGKKERVSTETLSAVSDILNLVKALISWLDRYPFIGQDKYVDVRKSVLKLSVELASTAQRDQFAEMPHEVIKECCSNLAAQSDKIVQEFNDSLIIQPASLEVAKVKRKIDDDLGIHINSSYTGIHVIEDIKFQSPAYRCGKVEEGDEIVQVNYQTVVGWQVKNIICAMQEHPSEVHITLKKRPRHPNVLGQVITLWPYRIPSKKTAFRKLYKWNKGKSTIDIRDMCPNSPDQRCELNNATENGTMRITEKERLLTGRSRSRIRRRATVTGISPTALQPPISLEELVGSNSRKKESIGRTVSYDPGKVVNVEDSVFKKESIVSDIQSKNMSSGNGIMINDNSPEHSDVNKTDSAKSHFLKPPPDFHSSETITHRKQEEKTKLCSSLIAHVPTVKTSGDCYQKSYELKQSEDAIKSPFSWDIPDKPSCFKPHPPTQGSSKHKLVDWVQKQRKWQDPVTTGNSVFHIDNPEENSYSKHLSLGKDSTSSDSPNCNRHELLPPVYDGHQTALDVRSVRKSSDSRISSEKTENVPNPRTATLQKQYLAQKRNKQQFKNVGSYCSNPSKVKEVELRTKLNGDGNSGMLKPVIKNADVYNHSEFMNSSSAARLPQQTHQSKIISLKSKSRENSNYAQAYNNPFLNTRRGLNNNQQGSFNQHKSQTFNQFSCERNGKLLKNSLESKKSVRSTAFHSPSGKSLSFNNIAFSSDDSNSEEYDEYEKLNKKYGVNKPHIIPQQTTSSNLMTPNFAAKFAEIYNMLHQGRTFYPPPYNHFSPESSAMIEELAKRMYHGIQMNHLQAQSKNPVISHPPVTNSQNNSEFLRNGLYPNNPHFQQYSTNGLSNVVHPNNYTHCFNPDCLPQNTSNVDRSNFERHCLADTVCEPHPNLPPTACLPNRPIHVFKSATSQEIHNLYTSRSTNKGSLGNPSNSLHGCNKHQTSSNFHQNGQCDSDHTYEFIQWHKDNNIELKDNSADQSNVNATCNGNTGTYLAEKELEQELPCKDSTDVINSNMQEIQKLLKHDVDHKLSKPFKAYSRSDNMNNSSLSDSVNSSENYYNCWKQYKNSQLLPNSEGEGLPHMSCKNTLFSRILDCKQSGNIESGSREITEMTEVSYPSREKLQMTISSIFNSVPKPPETDYEATVTSSAVQTDIEVCGSQLMLEALDVNNKTENSYEFKSIANDESFVSSLNSFQTSAPENKNFSSNSSLNSSTSGSVVSSAGSCYYFVEPQNRSHNSHKLSSTSSDNADENSLPEALRSTLPTMGVSMLSKKRTISSSSSDLGSGLPLSSPIISSKSLEENCVFPKSPLLITDVEHTI